MCFVLGAFICVYVCVCVCVCVCGAGQPSQHNTKINVTCAHTEVSRYISVVSVECVCAYVRARSRACSHVIFVRSYNCVVFFCFFWRVIICCSCERNFCDRLWLRVFLLPSLMFIFLLWVRDCAWDRVVVCECVFVQFCERLSCAFFSSFCCRCWCVIFLLCARTRTCEIAYLYVRYYFSELL